MPSPRTCSHIKANGSKCGSPALKFHTLCYFHFEWQNRRFRRQYSDRDGGRLSPFLPPLESKASIIFAICEIQASLLAGYIDNKIARTLLYAVQLAIQVKASEDDLNTTTPATCPELDSVLAEDRRLHQRPPQPVCDACPKADDCPSSDDCIHSTAQIRELERIHEPERYAKDRAAESEAKRQSDEVMAKFEKNKDELRITQPVAYQYLFGSTPKAASAPEPSSTCLEGARLQPCRKDEEATGASAPEVVLLPAPLANEINILGSNS